MRNTRWLATTGYTLYKEDGKEYVFYLNQEDESLSMPLTYRELSDGIEFLDENSELVFVSWDNMEIEIE
jgi:translation elongation factor P/translation initiation factor 5A